jgi:long-chain fatty acid transport protein
MRYHFTALLLVLLLLTTKSAHAQSFGVELFNNVMPASGAMAGASIASPQDVQSAIYGNPATMTQYRGTNVGFSGLWIEPTYNVSVGAPLVGFGVTPFNDAKSDAQGIAGGNIGVTQDFSALGMPVTVGMGLMAGSGAGVDLRHIPQSNGTHANIVALDIVSGAALDLTDRLSLGGSMVLSNATLDGPFVGLTGASSDYGLSGTVGVDYELRPDTTVGVYWKAKMGFTFENLAGFVPGTFLDVEVDRPAVLGMGISNSSLMDGCLLLAMDAVYLQYTDTDLFGAIFNDQWALQFGAQYAPNERVRLRLGYAWNENPMRQVVGAGAGGVLPPGGAAHMQYIEALFAAIPQHRFTGGLTIRDVLPGIDWSLFAGGAFEASQTFGVTTADVKSYWIGAGLTWYFDRGACEAGEWQYPTLRSNGCL